MIVAVGAVKITEEKAKISDLNKQNFHLEKLKMESAKLTDEIQSHRVAPNGLSGDLAFIETSVSLLSKFDLQSPLIRLLVMCRRETLVSRVCVSANGENMQISMTNP